MDVTWVNEASKIKEVNTYEIYDHCQGYNGFRREGYAE